MQRRTLLLFGLFVVTAWFYSSVAHETAETTASKHQKQIQALKDAEEGIANEDKTASQQDPG